MQMRYPFKTVPLPYSYDALEPYIDTQTMQIHHDKHYQTYVDNLNKALINYPEYHKMTLVSLLGNLSNLPYDIRTQVRNNGGGTFNHLLYFNLLKKDTKPIGKLSEQIIRQYGTFDNFRNEFKKAGLERFGSGWVWLANDDDGKLFIISTPNQDTVIQMSLNPILAMDVWEHAYYLKHQNRRTDYIDNWFKVINWNEAENNYMNSSISYE
jgi:Fe-Mn family superoxide dismutase